MNRVKLERFGRSNAARRWLQDKVVRIWSGEWCAYWRPGGNGYTDRRALAGVFTGDMAMRHSGHAGPEKQIQFEIVR